MASSPPPAVALLFRRLYSRLRTHRPQHRPRAHSPLLMGLTPSHQVFRRRGNRLVPDLNTRTDRQLGLGRRADSRPGLWAGASLTHFALAQNILNMPKPADGSYLGEINSAPGHRSEVIPRHEGLCDARISNAHYRARRLPTNCETGGNDDRSATFDGIADRLLTLAFCCAVRHFQIRRTVTSRICRTRPTQAPRPV